MKFYWVSMVVSLLGFAAYAGECKLAHPLPLPTKLPEYGITFKNAVVDQVPQFQRATDYDPAKNTLDLSIFPIHSDVALTDFMGASIDVDSNAGSDAKISVGNSNIYQNVKKDLSGKTTRDGDVEIHQFRYHEYFVPVGGPEDPWYGCTICKSGNAYERTKIEITEGAVTSVQISFPVQVVWKEDASGTYLAYTGQQTLCVKDAEVSSQ